MPRPPRSWPTVPGSAVTWGALGLAVIAVSSLLVVGVASSSKPNGPSAPATTTTTIRPVASGAPSLDEVNPPLTAPVTIERPATAGSHRYRSEEGVAVVDLGFEHCGSRDGMIGAGGTFRNASPAGQTVDATIGVHLVRALTGASIGRFTAVLEDVRSGESKEWRIETRTSRVIRVRCDITQMTISPSLR